MIGGRDGTVLRGPSALPSLWFEGDVGALDARNLGGEGEEGVDDLADAPIVPRQPTPRSAREILAIEASHVECGGPAEPVDRLLRVADDPEIAAVAGERLEEPDAAPVHILVFVDENVLVA